MSRSQASLLARLAVYQEKAERSGPKVHRIILNKLGARGAIGYQDCREKIRDTL